MCNGGSYGLISNVAAFEVLLQLVKYLAVIPDHLQHFLRTIRGHSTLPSDPLQEYARSLGGRFLPFEDLLISCYGVCFQRATVAEWLDGKER